MGGTYKPLDRHGPEAPLVDLADLAGWIVHEDDDLIVVDKPGWIVCHPSKNGPLSSLVGACREFTGLEKLHLISRLDRETTGIVILAKRPAIARQLQKAMEERRVDKLYLAILRGELRDNLSVDVPLGRDNRSLVHIKQRGRPEGGGKSAMTLFEPIAAANDYTLARVKILTGRKHQIRAHALHVGHMVAGDKIYGPDECLYLDFIEDGWTSRHDELLEIKRQALHAWKITIHCPERDFAYCAPMPKDMQQLCVEKLGGVPDF